MRKKIRIGETVTVKVRFNEKEDMAIVHAMHVVEPNNWTAVAAKCADVLHIKHQGSVQCRDRCRNLMFNEEKRAKYFGSQEFEAWNISKTTKYKKGTSTPPPALSKPLFDVNSC
jgi:predicted nucleic acid-binding Zn ribbon protein